MRWYFRWHRPNMKAEAGAVWPVVAHQDKWEDVKPSTLVHEEVHLKDQLHMLLIPWLLLYALFHVWYGYRKNPFEVHGFAVGSGKVKFKPFGWVKFLSKKSSF